MVAEQRNRAVLDLAQDRVDREARIGAVAHIVAEENETRDAVAAGVAQARLQRFAVGVNVAEQPDPHLRLTKLKFGNLSLSLTAVNGIDLRQRRASRWIGADLLTPM